MIIRALLLSLAMALSIGVNVSSAVTIGDLTQPGAAIEVGDKLFSDFVLSAGVHSPQGIFSPASASSVVVTGITIAGDHGLRFTGPFSVDGTVVQSVFSFNLTYDVTVTDPSMLLH